MITIPFYNHQDDLYPESDASSSFLNDLFLLKRDIRLGEAPCVCRQPDIKIDSPAVMVHLARNQRLKGENTPIRCYMDSKGVMVRNPRVLFYVFAVNYKEEDLIWQTLFSTNLRPPNLRIMSGSTLLKSVDEITKLWKVE